MTDGPSGGVELGAKGFDGEEEALPPPPPAAPTGELGADGRPVILGGRIPIGCCAV